MAHGTCACIGNFTGDDCSLRRCPRDCSGNGVCDHRTGNCNCNLNSAGPACDRRTALGDAKVALACAQECLKQCNVAGGTSVDGHGSELPGLDKAGVRAYADSVSRNNGSSSSSALVGCLQSCEHDCAARGGQAERQALNGTEAGSSLMVSAGRGSQMLGNAHFDEDSQQWEGADADTKPNAGTKSKGVSLVLSSGKSAQAFPGTGGGGSGSGSGSDNGSGEGTSTGSSSTRSAGGSIGSVGAVSVSTVGVLHDGDVPPEARARLTEAAPARGHTS